MKNNSLTTTHLLNFEAINRHQLTLSLINQGASVEIFSLSQVEKMQTQLMTILNNAILEYTHHQSNSVKTETAHNIFQSILYCCDYFLLDLCIEEATSILLTVDMDEIYLRGLQKVKDEVNLAKIIETNVQTTKLDIPLIAYNDTINQSFADFWSNYDEYYDAHNTPTSIDYPLLVDDMSWTGIVYIKNYLEKLLLENEFCLCFPQQEIAQLLKGCGEKYSMDYREMLISIPEQILNNVLCSTLLKKNISLMLSQSECLLLEKKMQALSDKECHTQLAAALQYLFNELKITNLDLQRHLLSFIDTLSPRLINAVRMNSLSGLIVILQDSPASESFHYKTGKNISNEHLRLVIDELQLCHNGVAKAALIKSEIHSLEDLIEIFGAYCIFDDEYNDIFGQMGEYDLAVLAADLWDDPWHRTENEFSWKKQLITYLQDINPSVYEKVVHLSKKLKKSYV